jgi:hypothetical protein
VAEIFFKVICSIHFPPLSREVIPHPAEGLSCLVVVEEETAKILPWPLAAVYGTESESKYDVNKLEAFVALLHRPSPPSQTTALISRALMQTSSLLNFTTIQSIYISIARACRERASID